MCGRFVVSMEVGIIELDATSPCKPGSVNLRPTGGGE